MDKTRASYLKAVEKCFLALRGSGWMLSPQDVALVDRWREAGLPLRTVLRVIETSVERFTHSHPRGEPLPSTIRYFEGAMERAMVARRDLMLDGERDCAVKTDLREDHVAAILTRIADEGGAQQHEGAREVMRDAWRVLKAAESTEDLWALTSRVDDVIVDGLIALLSDDERNQLLDASEIGDARMGALAREHAQRMCLERAVRSKFGVSDLVEMLIETGV